MKQSSSVKLAKLMFAMFMVFICSLIIFEEQVDAAIICTIIFWFAWQGWKLFKSHQKTLLKKQLNFIQSESELTNFFIQLVSLIIEIDGEKSEKELNYIENHLGSILEIKDMPTIIAQVKQSKPQSDAHFKKLYEFIEIDFNINSRIQLIHLLAGVCAADGILTVKEETLLKVITHKLGLPQATLIQILLMFRFKHEREQQKKQYRQKRPKYTSQSQLKTALGILGLTENSSNIEIKKAYRKLAVKHHPDKVAHLGKEMQLLAKEQFLIISEAYELLKTKKGFS